jgi:hypothetical protein
MLRVMPVMRPLRYERNMCPVLLVTAGGILTAGAMLFIGWGLAEVAMMGPRASIRIAALVPQVEVTILFLVGLWSWTRLLRAEESSAFRTALASTARGCRRRIWGTTVKQLADAGLILGGGAVIWGVASLAGLGPSLGDIICVRVLLFAFAIFGIGLGVWARTMWRHAHAAAGAAFLALLIMAGTPFLSAPLIAVMGPWRPLVQASMLCNPWIVAAGISRLDLLHMQWIYALSPLGSVETYYPGLITAVAAYGGSGVLLLFWSASALAKPIR